MSASERKAVDALSRALSSALDENERLRAELEHERNAVSFLSHRLATAERMVGVPTHPMGY